MSATYRVTHRTCYRYGETVPLCHNEARVLPRPMDGQTVRAEKLTLSPPPDDLHERCDYFGNRVHYYSVQHPHEEATTLSEFEVTLRPEARPDPRNSTTEWQPWHTRLMEGPPPPAEVLAARPWTYASPRIPLLPQLADYAREVFLDIPGLMEACLAFMARIHSEFTFDQNSTSVTTSVAEAFSLRHGVCQDFTHVMVAGLRGIGLPARYVSGYIETLPPPGQTKLEGADATHAWVSVCDPALGWVDFDPTNNLVPAGQHITLGWGRDFSDVIPVKGVVTGGEHQVLDVAVDVKRVG